MGDPFLIVEDAAGDLQLPRREADAQALALKTREPKRAGSGGALGTPGAERIPLSPGITEGGCPHNHD